MSDRELVGPNAGDEIREGLGMAERGVRVSGCSSIMMIVPRGFIN